LQGDGDPEQAELIMRRAASIGHQVDPDLGIKVFPNLVDLPYLIQQDSAYAMQARIPLLSFPTLNKCLGGGSGRRQIYCVMGYPGIGKSTLMRCFAYDAIRCGIPVVHYTIGDLSQLEVTMLYAQLMTGTTVEQIINNDPAYTQAAINIQQFRGYLRVKEFHPNTVTAEAIHSHLTELRANDGLTPGVIIIDYPEELLPLKTKEDHWTNQALTINRLTEITHEFNAVTYWAWHPTKTSSREIRGFRPEKGNEVKPVLTMADGQGAFAQARGLDGAISLNQDDTERQIGVGRLWIDKLRRGKKPGYPIELQMRMDVGRIIEAGA
jgi:hypothetical protein